MAMKPLVILLNMQKNFGMHIKIIITLFYKIEINFSESVILMLTNILGKYQNMQIMHYLIFCNIFSPLIIQKIL